MTKMVRKIAVLLNHHDNNVQALSSVGDSRQTTADDYADYIAKYILPQDKVFKSKPNVENENEFSSFDIWKHQLLLIYNSSFTIVLISSNMKDTNKPERLQWIPWEISYSIQETMRISKRCRRNPICAVVLPDQNGNYSYYNESNLFGILSKNIRSGYIEVVEWKDFVKTANYYLIEAYARHKKAPRELIYTEI